MSSRRLAVFLSLAVFVPFPLAGFAAKVDTAPIPPPASTPKDASLDDYRNHLIALNGVVEACAKARNDASCDPASVGADDELPLAGKSERRLVRYGWLRALLEKAREKDAPPPKVLTEPAGAPATWENVRPIPATTSQLLEAAKARLAGDLAQTQTAATPLPNHAQERNVMKQVLAGREYRDLEAPSEKESAMEKVGNWLDRMIESAVKASARAPWLGRALVWGFIAAVCIGLVWGLIQMERRWRVRLVPEESGPAPGAASAIPYQLWLEDARRAAAAGLWREAIHFLYWAAISRLESKRLWPADRARTPREYLALVAADDPRLTGLASLTRSFETVWYGGRAAAESDYLRAEQIASALIQGSAAGLEARAESAPASAGGGAP